MPEGNINNANKMLFFRTVLCFDEGSNEKVTVTSISKKLNVEKYKISRIISTLTEQGIVEKDAKGVPSLTEKGKKFIEEYHKKVDVLISFLLRAGLNPQYARDVALHIAGNANDTIMDFVRQKELKMQTKEALENSAKFSGSQFAKKMKSGSYKLPYMIIVENGHAGFQFASQTTDNSAVLNVVNQKGSIQLHIDTSKIRDFKYLLNGEWIQSEKVGDIFFLPAEALTFIQIAKAAQESASFCGMVNIMITNFENKEVSGALQVLF